MKAFLLLFLIVSLTGISNIAHTTVCSNGSEKDKNEAFCSSGKEEVVAIVTTVDSLEKQPLAKNPAKFLKISNPSINSASTTNTNIPRNTAIAMRGNTGDLLWGAVVVQLNGIEKTAAFDCESDNKFSLLAEILGVKLIGTYVLSVKVSAGGLTLPATPVVLVEKTAARQCKIEMLKSATITPYLLLSNDKISVQFSQSFSKNIEFNLFSKLLGFRNLTGSQFEDLKKAHDVVYSGGTASTSAVVPTPAQKNALTAAVEAMDEMVAKIIGPLDFKKTERLGDEIDIRESQGLEFFPAKAGGGSVKIIVETKLVLFSERTATVVGIAPSETPKEFRSGSQITVADLNSIETIRLKRLSVNMVSQNAGKVFSKAGTIPGKFTVIQVSSDKESTDAKLLNLATSLGHFTTAANVSSAISGCDAYAEAVATAFSLNQTDKLLVLYKAWGLYRTQNSQAYASFRNTCINLDERSYDYMNSAGLNVDIDSGVSAQALNLEPMTRESFAEFEDKFSSMRSRPRRQDRRARAFQIFESDIWVLGSIGQDLKIDPEGNGTTGTRDGVSGLSLEPNSVPDFFSDASVKFTKEDPCFFLDFAGNVSEASYAHAQMVPTNSTAPASGKIIARFRISKLVSETFPRVDQIKFSILNDTEASAFLTAQNDGNANNCALE